MLTTMALFISAVVFLSDWSLLGLWTLPATAGLLIVAWIAHAKMGPKLGDARGEGRLSLNE
jgi:hypothetical protein